MLWIATTHRVRSHMVTDAKLPRGARLLSSTPNRQTESRARGVLVAIDGAGADYETTVLGEESVCRPSHSCNHNRPEERVTLSKRHPPPKIHPYACTTLSFLWQQARMPRLRTRGHICTACMSVKTVPIFVSLKSLTTPRKKGTNRPSSPVAVPFADTRNTTYALLSTTHGSWAPGQELQGRNDTARL